jgi:dsRNA-specific ribonuclease
MSTPVKKPELDEEKLLELKLRREKNQSEMLTPINPTRGPEFQKILLEILIHRGNIKDHYADLLLSKNLHLYENAFTSNSINSYKNPDPNSDNVLQDKDNGDNYDVFKIFGDNIFENFMILYIFRRFPTLRSADDVKVLARMKIEYGIDITFPNMAQQLGFGPYIASSLYEKNNKENTLLQNSLSAFLGVTYYGLERLTGVYGAGFAVCYDILKSLFDELNIPEPSNFDELNNPITVLKEFFDSNQYVGKLIIPFETNYDYDLMKYICKIYYEKDGVKTLLGTDQAKLKKESEKLASIKAILELKRRRQFVEKKREKKKLKPLEIGQDVIIYGQRDHGFRNMIEKIIRDAKIDEKYSQYLLTEEAFEIYDQAFTSNSANLLPSGHIDTKSTQNYEVYETLGDVVFKNFIVYYSAMRFDFFLSKDAKVISRIKINYGSDKEFAKLAKMLGFQGFITSSEYEEREEPDKLLEDTFEAFLGATAYILDHQFRIGVGYSICYTILKNIYDKIEIPTEFKLLLDAVSRLKEFFDKNKEYGTMDFRQAGYGRVRVFAKGGEKGDEFLGMGNNPKPKEAKEEAARNAIEYLKKKGFEDV